MFSRIEPLLPVLARCFAAALLLAAGNSCSGGSSPTAVVDIDPNFGTNDPSVVVALGDSITFGVFDEGVDLCSESYRGTAGFCPRLARLTGKTVINEGACGETSGSGASRVASVLQAWRPGVLLIDYSPNDFYTGSDVVIANLRAMITAARNNHTVPILGTLTPATSTHRGWEPFIEGLNIDIRALCTELSVECADHYQAFVSDPSYIASPDALLSEDGLHPNAAGYEVMARTWRWPLLRVY